MKVGIVYIYWTSF